MDEKCVGIYQDGDNSYLGYTDSNGNEQSFDITSCIVSGEEQPNYISIGEGTFTFVTICGLAFDLNDIGNCEWEYAPVPLEAALPRDLTPVKSLCLIGNKHVEIDQWHSKPYVSYTDVNGNQKLFEVSGDAKSLTAQDYTNIGRDTFVTIDSRKFNLSDIAIGAACGGGTVVPTCRNNRVRCTNSSSCCSRYCEKNICKPPPIYNCTDSKECNEIPPVLRNSLMVMTERKSPSNLIHLLGWYEWRSTIISSCIRGSPCANSTGCCGYECVDSICLCGVNGCSASGECCTGYCENGKCRTPPVMSLSNPQIQGCSGLIEECLPGEVGCINICNGLMALLLITSIVAGLVAWKRFNHPAPGIAAAVIPILFGLIFYVFVGIISAIFEIAMIVKIKDKSNIAQSSVSSQKKTY
jgi:hypothetical protein